MAIAVRNYGTIMAGKKYNNKDLVQGAGSLWLLVIVVIYFGDRRIFYQVLVLSLIALGLLLGLVAIVRKRRFGHILEQSDGQRQLAKLRQMKPDEFEDFIADLYRRLGYATERVGGSPGGGIDVTAKKNGVIYYIQCKKFINSKVTIHNVRDFYATMANNLAAGKGIFITTNIFTAEAIKFAADRPLALIDGVNLLTLIKQAGKDDQPT